MVPVPSHEVASSSNLATIVAGELPLSGCPAGRLVVSLEHLFRKQLEPFKVVGEEMDEAAVLAKNLPFLPREFLRKFY